MAGTMRVPPPGGLTGSTPTSATITRKATSDHDMWVTLLFELLGVSLLAVLGDINENIGKLLVVLMVGWLLLFLMLNATWLSTVVPGASAGSGPSTSITNSVIGKLG